MPGSLLQQLWIHIRSSTYLCWCAILSCPNKDPRNMYLSCLGRFKAFKISSHTFCTFVPVFLYLCYLMQSASPVLNTSPCSPALFPCIYLYMNRGLWVHWRSHLKGKPLVHTLSGSSLRNACGDVAFEKRQACVLEEKKDRGWAEERQKCASVPPSNKASSVCLLLPGSCGGYEGGMEGRERGGRCDLSGSEEGAGWTPSHHPFSSSNFPFIL